MKTHEVKIIMGEMAPDLLTMVLVAAGIAVIALIGTIRFRMKKDMRKRVMFDEMIGLAVIGAVVVAVVYIYLSRL